MGFPEIDCSGFIKGYTFDANEIKKIVLPDDYFVIDQDGEDLKTLYDRKMNEHFLLSYSDMGKCYPIIKPTITGNPLAPKIDWIADFQTVGKKCNEITSKIMFDLGDTYRRFKEANKVNKWAVEKIIFNPPATIVFWKDGSKTVVKCQSGQTYNPYFGFTAALAKKLYGSNSAVNRMVDKALNYPRKEIEKEEKEKKKKPTHNEDMIVKDCFNCEYDTRNPYEEPCKNCSRIHTGKDTKNQWVPKKQINYEFYEIDKCITDLHRERFCENCKYESSSGTQLPCSLCIHCRMGSNRSYWTAKEESK